MSSALVRLSGAFFIAAIAPAQEPAGQDATLQALLKEVHELRVAMERSNTIGPKVQIALARMQFEEERVRNASRQSQDAHDKVTDVQNKSAETGNRIKQEEARLNQATDPNERKQLDSEIVELKGQMEQLGTLQQQFQAKEAEANSLLMNEQAKWNEANDLLTAIERLMTPAQP